MNFFTYTVRLFLKDKFYTLLNLFGLAFGLACCILIFLYLKSELTYDHHHSNFERIYRATSIFTIEGVPDHLALASMGFAPLAKEEFPEIEAYTRMRAIGQRLFKVGDKSFYEENIWLADSSVFEVFDLPFVYGGPDGALRDLNAILLTKSMARKYFGDVNPIDSIITYEGLPLIITGVLEDLPENTHLQFEALRPFHLATRNWPREREQQAARLWSVDNYTYFRMPEGYDPKNFDRRYPDFYMKYMDSARDGMDGSFTVKLQPLGDVHFGKGMKYDLPTGNYQYILGFGAAGLFILLVACINYMNLATARSVRRANEVGMRKVLGATRRQLIGRFLSESVLLAFLSLFFAFGLVEATLNLSGFTSLVNKELVFSLWDNPSLLWFCISLTLMVGLVSGLYPALYLSAIKPVSSLKGNFRFSLGGILVRKGLVTFQFVITIGVIISTFLMRDQMNYVLEKDLGFESENILYVQVRDTGVANRLPVVLEELEKHPQINKAEISSVIPGLGTGRVIHRVEQEGGEMQEELVNLMYCGWDFLKLMNVEFLEGENFNQERPTDLRQAFIINEAAKKAFGWKKSLGKRIISNADTTRNGRVIGVVKNFHSHSLLEQVDPLVIEVQHHNGGAIHVKYEGEESPVIAHTEKIMSQFDPQHPFEYDFVSDDLTAQYTNEKAQSSLITILALICIFIATLGLLGLASFTIQQRTKEIGVRKVLGASVLQIMGMIFKEFFWLIGLASLFSIPIALWFIKSWLEKFAYRVDIDYFTFPQAILICGLLTFLAIGYHVYRAAMGNPVKALKYE